MEPVVANGSVANETKHANRVAPAFVERLRQLGSKQYHHQHPFNLLMHAGRLTPQELRCWVANRYYYQTRIPIKDALIVGKSHDVHFRRVWVRRILEHDGQHDGADANPGGLALWRRLGEAVGLSDEALEAHEGVLPAVRGACDHYVELVSQADLVTAVASSLTEYFAPGLMRTRVQAWQQHYSFVEPSALAYFTGRVRQAADDGDFALEYVIAHATDEAQQLRCLDAFERKCAILWTLLDAVYIACRKEMAPYLDRRVSFVEHSRGRESQGLDGSRDEHSEAPDAMLVMPEKALQLNVSGQELTSLCDGSHSTGQVVATLAARHGLAPEVLELQIATFLGELECRRVLHFAAKQ